jgi:glycosyltransferase involved in cell wall biosynthesis
LTVERRAAIVGDPVAQAQISLEVGLRIGFVSMENASDATSWSGIPFQILEHLRAQGIDVEVLSPLDSKIKYAAVPAKAFARLRGETLSLIHFPIVLRSYARQIESILRSHPVDVVVSTSTVPITFLQCRQPIVAWTDAVFHAMRSYYGDAFSNLTRGAIERGEAQEQTALRRCSIAAYASTWAVNAAGRITDASKLRLLPFGSSLPVRHSAEDVATMAKKKRANGRQRCELLFVGVDWDRKGGDVAVETARLLNDAGIETALRVVGPSKKVAFPRFVEPLGFINKNSEEGVQRLVTLFQSADFFILPTKAEAAGIVFSEASSYGLPTLTYATGGVPDYVRHGVNGFCFAPGTPASVFADKIRELLSNPDEYEAISARAFREYEERLNWKTSVQKLIQICRQSVAA